MILFFYESPLHWVVMCGYTDSRSEKFSLCIRDETTDYFLRLLTAMMHAARTTVPTATVTHTHAAG